MNNEEKNKNKIFDSLLFVLLIGSLWGVSEVVLSVGLKSAGIQFRSGILTGVGIGLMAVALSYLRKPLLLIPVSIITVLCKQLVVPMLNVSVMCNANSCVAVFLQAGILTGVTYFLTERLSKRKSALFAVGASAALLSAVAFYYIGMKVAPCNYLLSFNTAGGFVSFLYREGLNWALISGILFPAGYWVGNKLRETVFESHLNRAWIYYFVSSVLIVACWLSSALIISAGYYDHFKTF
ncbi:MAG: hypothetical protein A2V66_04080 [Ignavibacteria bacterium RBG_13_36_8]|nr:MAG: hypothetical protein A2V66_04080 [Ignavibacteria bacterium RBG_13_36_8]